MARNTPLQLVLALVACNAPGAPQRDDDAASAGIGGPGETGTSGASGEDSGAESTAGAGDEAPTGDEAPASDDEGGLKFDLATMDIAPPVCDAPDVLFVLDRSVSMRNRPDGTKPPNTAAGRAETKWGRAVAAIETATAQTAGIRFGL